MLFEARSKNCVTRRRTTSGSLAETNDVESTRSTNRTVASFRSIQLLSVETNETAFTIPRDARSEGLQSVRRARDLSARNRRGRGARDRAGLRRAVRAETDRRGAGHAHV